MVFIVALMPTSFQYSVTISVTGTWSLACMAISNGISKVLPSGPSRKP